MAEITAAALDKRREIVRKAAVLFDTKGYASTSMIDIAGACGLQKPTLYHYFPRKDAILFEIHDQLMDHLQARLDDRRAAPGARAVEVIEGTVHDVLAAFASHPGFPRVFTEAHRELRDDHRETVTRKRDRYADEFEELVSEAVADGDLRPLDPTLTRLSVLGMVSWAYHWLQVATSHEVDGVATFMWDIVFRGMSPQD